MTKYAIVGSRRRDSPEDMAFVLRVVLDTKPDDIIISGGCDGVDTWAITFAEVLGRKTEVFKPDFTGAKGYYDFVKAYYARNRKVAEACDYLIALVRNDRKGGAENTIRHAQELGKAVIAVYQDFSIAYWEPDSTEEAEWDALSSLLSRVADSTRLLTRTSTISEPRRVSATGTSSY